MTLNPTLEHLTTRRSVKKFTAPAPDSAQIDAMLQAATQVPDHGRLTPYRFAVIAGEKAHKKLAKVTDKKGKIRAPLVIAVIAAPQIGKKPKWEQHITAGCAAYAIQLAAHAQGFVSFWLTGKAASGKKLRKALNCGKHEKIIALLLIGSAAKARHTPKNTRLERYVDHW